MHHFTPIQALIGGSLIGLSAVLLLLINGRIAGISGMLHGLIPMRKNEFLWRLLFLTGLFTGGFIYYFIPSIHFLPREQYPKYLLITSGFLVGIGTKLANGCTSGHGICGMARLSTRSLTATAVFFIFGLGTVYILKHVFLI